MTDTVEELPIEEIEQSTIDADWAKQFENNVEPELPAIEEVIEEVIEQIPVEEEVIEEPLENMYQYKLVNGEIQVAHFLGLHEGWSILPNELHGIDPALLKMEDGQVTVNVVSQALELKKQYIAKITNLCDTKAKAAEFIIAQKTITENQKERYKTKAKHARNITGRNTVKLEQVALLQNTTVEALIAESVQTLTPTAHIAGVDVNTYAEIIVATETAWAKAVDTFYTLIEAYKTKAYALLEAGDYTVLDTFLTEGESLGIYTDGVVRTPQEILTDVYTKIMTLLA